MPPASTSTPSDCPPGLSSAAPLSPLRRTEGFIDAGHANTGILAAAGALLARRMPAARMVHSRVAFMRQTQSAAVPGGLVSTAIVRGIGFLFLWLLLAGAHLADIPAVVVA